MDKELFTNFIIYIAVTLSILITLVNVICITVILACPKLRQKPPMVFIVNLLATHLLQGVFVLPIYAVKKSKDYPLDLYPFVCDAWRLSYMLTFYGTCINVLLVAVDRYVATKYAMSAKIVLTTKRCRIICAVAWIYITALCLIPFIPLERSRSLKTSKCNYNQPKQWTIFMLMANTVVPFLLVTLIYAYIIQILRQTSSTLQKVNSIRNETPRKKIKGGQPKTSSPINKKLTWLTIKITLTYGVTWLPSIVYYNIVTIAPDTFSAEFYVSDTESLITFFIKYITFFDAVLAPIIYCHQSRDFRRAFRDFRARIMRNWYAFGKQ
ncbi:alpha-1B adrenergic receptor-like [Clytia hemisphaerica]|uniref:G-protein coupled receptors family 1 profile domain-containing protein n=1 Tax=Clytia hemisphaerica TaxID=252671 RepID=A0A7M5X408_9CNID